jgi:nitrogen fixation NifU-like protein
MPDLHTLYHELILDHSRSPRNHREMPDADLQQEGRNPLCGDHVHVWLRMDGDRIADVSFVGKGCAISQASASIMTTAVKGKTREEAEALFNRFHDLVTGHLSDEDAEKLPSRLGAFSGVARFPVRVKCASLSWHALRSALREEPRTASPE